MAYTQPWQPNFPLPTSVADQIDVYIRNDKTATQERIQDLFTIADFTADPLVPTSIPLNRTAHSTILGGTTDISIRNAANDADNVLVADAGDVTIRTSLTVPSLKGNINFPNNLTVTGTATFNGNVSISSTKSLTVQKILPASGGFVIRNSTDTQDNFRVFDAQGDITARGGFTGTRCNLSGSTFGHILFTAGSTPTTLTDGALWVTSTAVFIRLNGVTKQFTLT